MRWQLVKQIAKFHHVWVLTNDKYRADIEESLEEGPSGCRASFLASFVTSQVTWREPARWQPPTAGARLEASQQPARSCTGVFAVASDFDPVYERVPIAYGALHDAIPSGREVAHDDGPLQVQFESKIEGVAVACFSETRLKREDQASSGAATLRDSKLPAGKGRRVCP